MKIKWSVKSTRNLFSVKSSSPKHLHIKNDGEGNLCKKKTQRFSMRAYAELELQVWVVHSFAFVFLSITSPPSTSPWKQSIHGYLVWIYTIFKRTWWGYTRALYTWYRCIAKTLRAYLGAESEFPVWPRDYSKLVPFFVFQGASCVLFSLGKSVWLIGERR